MDPNLKYEILSDDFSQYDLSFKLIVVGDSGVGKSCLTLKATKNYFEDNYSPTVGFEFFTFNVKINDQNIKLQIWDTCGQEVYRSLIASFYRNSSLAIMVYSIDDENSFNHLDSWLNEIKSQSSADIKVFLIGNKVDLEDKRKIQSETAQTFADEHKLEYFSETSAKTGFNAQNVFVKAAQILYQEHLKYKDRASRPGSLSPMPYTPELHGQVLEDEGRPKKKKGGCC